MMPHVILLMMGLRRMIRPQVGFRGHQLLGAALELERHAEGKAGGHQGRLRYRGERHQVDLLLAQHGREAREAGSCPVRSLSRPLSFGFFVFIYYVGSMYWICLLYTSPSPRDS